MTDLYYHDGEPRGEFTARECVQHAIEWGMVPVEPDDIMNAAHKLVHPMYDNAADCDKFWCEPFRALKVGIGEETP